MINLKKPGVTIAIEAHDLSAATGEPLDMFTAGKCCRACLPDEGESYVYQITGLYWPNLVQNPSKCNITMSTVDDRRLSHTKQKTGGGGGGGGGGGTVELTLTYTDYCDYDPEDGSYLNFNVSSRFVKIKSAYLELWSNKQNENGKFNYSIGGTTINTGVLKVQNYNATSWVKAGQTLVVSIWGCTINPMRVYGRLTVTGDYK